MAGILQQEWLNQNAGRNYPFAENAQLTSTAGLRLPNYVVVDFVFTVPATEPVGIYLAQLAVVGNLMTFAFRETANNGAVGTVTVDVRTHVANAGYTVAGAGDWEDCVGRLVIGDLGALALDLPDGLYTFTADQAPFEPCTVRPALRGVRSLRLQNGINVSDYIYGNVTLRAGRDIQLTYDEGANAIWIHVVPGAGDEDYAEPCDCRTAAEKNVVKTINGIAIEDVVLVGSDCVEVTTSGNTIKFRDKCSEPCCGCAELEFLTDTMKSLEASLSRIEAYSQQLNTQITTFVLNFVVGTL